ncbi:MAG: bestrophin family protein [Myxococcota bacterium]
MIVEGSTHLVRLLKPEIRPVLAVAVILVLVELGNDRLGTSRPAFSFAAVGFLVTALSIFLVFRVNEAYARWWEARTLWGRLVNASRGFARQATTLLHAPSQGGDAPDKVDALQRELVHRQIAFAFALRLSLRGQGDWHELAPLLAGDELAALDRAANKPTWLLQRQGRRIAEAQRAGRLSELGQLMLNESLNQLHDVQGGCERIKHTAFPDRVAYFSKLVAWMVASLVAIVVMDPENGFDVIDWVVVPAMMLGFVITERVGAELRNPFESRPNDTPMTALCRTIEIDLRQVLGEEEVPEPLQPEGGILM